MRKRSKDQNFEKIKIHTISLFSNPSRQKVDFKSGRSAFKVFQRINFFENPLGIPRLVQNNRVSVKYVVFAGSIRSLNINRAVIAYGTHFRQYFHEMKIGFTPSSIFIIMVTWKVMNFLDFFRFSSNIFWVVQYLDVRL